jgi:competence protein ComEC
MKRPFVCITLFFSLGILFASRVSMPLFAAIPIAALCCVLCALHICGDTANKIVFVCSVFFCGAVALGNFDTRPKNHYRNILSSISGSRCVVNGRVASEARENGSRGSFTISVRRIASGNYSYDCTGDLLVVVNGPAPVEPGQIVDADGKVGYFPAFRGAQRTGLGDYYRQKNIFAVLRVKAPSRIRLAGHANRPDLFALCSKAGKKIRGQISIYMSPVAAAIMKAMLLGYKNDIPRKVYNDMIKTGTVHILVVSGFNVGVVAGSLALILKILRLNRIIRLAIISPALVLYCLMTGASPPVVRATIMGIFFFLSRYAQRDPDIFQALSMSAFAILICNPRELFDASFQLSFASVTAICFLSPRLERLCRADRIPAHALRRAAGLAAVSLSAWIGTSGFIAYYFRIIAPITVLANIFIPVLASLITLCGIGLAAAAYLCPYLANSFASVSEFLIVLMLWLNSLFINFPGAYARLP